MTAAAGQATDPAPDVTGVAQRMLRRNLWPIGLIVFLVLLFAFTKLIQPSYGVTGIQGLAISVLPARPWPPSPRRSSSSRAGSTSRSAR